MARQIIESPPGPESWLGGLGAPSVERMLSWEQAQAEACLADVFGYHAVQAGWSGVDTLQGNRMPHRWRARMEFDGPAPPADLDFDSRAWPWPADALDLVVLPHTLERSADPHACLREVERVLIPEGQVFISGLNPWSLWGWRQRRHQNKVLASGPHHWPVQPIAPQRLRDWLHLLGFEIQLQRFAGWTPTWSSERWVQRMAWMDAVGRRWCPILGGVYLMLATKRVPGSRMQTGKAWRKAPSRATLVAPAARLRDPARSCNETESAS